MKYIRIFFLLLFFCAIVLDFGVGKAISTMPGLSLKNITMYLLLLVIFSGNVLEKVPLFGKNDVNIPIILFISYCMMSMIAVYAFKPVPSYSIIGQLIFFKGYMDAFILTLIIFNLLHDIESVKFALFSLLLVYLFLILITLLGSLGIVTIQSVKVGKDFRTTGAFGEPNQFAAFIVIFIPLAINYFIHFRSIITKFFMAIICFTSIFCLFLTGSRGGFVALFVGIAALIFYNSNKMSLKLFFKNIGLFIVLLVFVAATFYILPKEARKGIEKNVVTRAQNTDDFRSDYSSGRLKIWKKCLGVFFENPITGSGWNTIRYKVGKNSHNEFLLYLTTTGIIGFSLYILIYFRLYRAAKIFRDNHSIYKHYYNSYIAGLLAFLAAMVFVNIYNPYFYFFIYSGLILKLGCLEAANIQKVQTE